jgi:hypothetical protein
VKGQAEKPSLPGTVVDTVAKIKECGIGGRVSVNHLDPPRLLDDEDPSRSVAGVGEKYRLREGN